MKVEEDTVHMYGGIILSIKRKKKRKNVICSNVDATRDYHTK